MKKSVDERIDADILWWVGHVERIENDRIAKRVYVVQYAGCHSAGRAWRDRLILLRTI